MTTSDCNPPASQMGGAFALTRWTLVLAAAEGGDVSGSRKALGDLCAIYWFPLYAYVRRRGHDVPEAEDLTQEFFSRLLAKNYLADADRRKGKFRSFLLASLKHFLANEWDRKHAAKRGGGRAVLSLDLLGAETRYGPTEPVDHLTPDKIFERQWALTVLEQALARLRAEFAAEGKDELFGELKQFLTAAGAESHAEVAAKCGMSEGAVKVAVHRIRHRYRQVLRSEIAQTVATPEEVDEEIRSLFAAFE